MTLNLGERSCVRGEPYGYIPALSGYGFSDDHLARAYGEPKQSYAGQSFWARGYFVATVGRDEKTIREYIRNQEKEGRRIDQMKLWK